MIPLKLKNLSMLNHRLSIKLFFRQNQPRSVSPHIMINEIKRKVLNFFQKRLPYKMKDKNISVHGPNDHSNTTGNSSKFNLRKSNIFKAVVQSLLLGP